jgi:hypothetical protein
MLQQQPAKQRRWLPVAQNFHARQVDHQFGLSGG